MAATHVLTISTGSCRPICKVVSVRLSFHPGVPAHMMLYIGEMRRNGIQHHAPPDDPDSLISLLLILLCGLVCFYAYKCYICLPISGNGL